MTHRSVTRRAAAGVFFALVAAFAAACGPAATSGADPTTSVEVEGAGSLGTATPTVPPIVDPTENPPTYPDTARAYAQAVVDAWAGDSPSWLQALTSTGVSHEIFDLDASPFDDWGFLRCDGAAGSSYCSFVNAEDGDVLTLRISNGLLGQAHAAEDVILDKTVYPTDGVGYVKAFVQAWKFGNTVRMLLLSSPDVVDAVPNAPNAAVSYPEPTCCGGGLLQVKVKWNTTTVRFDVGTTLLGGPHAILDYAPVLGLTL